jgi:hypothetical protein
MERPPESARSWSLYRFASMPIHDDKMFLTTTDARLYAVEALTGKIAW